MGLRGLLPVGVVGLAGVVVVPAHAATGFPLFAPQQLIARSSPGAPVSNVAAADLNCDGLKDVLVTRLLFRTDTTEPVSVFVNLGNGRFRDETSQLFVGSVPRTTHGRQIVIADFNGDGCDDAYIPDTGNDAPPHPGYPNTLILSAPGGRLTDASTNIPFQAAFTHSGTAADINGDGHVDIYEGNVCCDADEAPRILLNDGTGKFSVGSGLLPANLFGFDAIDLLISDMYRPYSSRFVDVNGDGRPDLVLGSGDHTSASLLLINGGDGHFHVAPDPLPPKPFDIAAMANGIGSGDLNGDGAQDLVLAYTKGTPYYEGSYLQILINDGTGRFRDETQTWLPQDQTNKDIWVAFVEITDINGDGRPDIVPHFFGGNAYDNTAPIYINEGDHFTVVPPERTGTYQGLYALVRETDGRLDIFTTDPSFNGVPEADYVLRELRAPPAVTAVTASRGTYRDGVHLAWKPADQAASYEVWRVSGSSRVRAGTTSTIHFVDRRARPGVSYRYLVRAANAAGSGPFASAGVGMRRR